MISACRRADDDPDGRLAIVAASGGISARVFEVAKLADLVSVFETREDAVRAVNGHRRVPAP